MAKRSRFSLISCSVLMVMAAGAGLAAESKSPPKPASAPPESYAPGLGDFMTAYVQPHHIKLWFAGSAGNWKLAAYEANELGETFDDVATYQAKWHDVPVAQLIKAIVDPALKSVAAAIEEKNEVAFKTAYGKLTTACNACHMTAMHEFLEIKIPEGNPFSDQKFGGH